MDMELQQWAQRIAAQRSSTLVYATVRGLVKGLFFPYFRVQHRGGEHLDITGPVIIAPVHRSNLDALLLSGIGHRRMRALAKQSLFKPRPFGWLLASLGAIPLQRGVTDRSAVRAAISILEANEQIIVFPEGTRQSGPQVGVVLDGMSYLAARCSAAIVPVGIAGTEQAMASGVRLPRRSRVALVAGRPLRPPEGRLSRRGLTRLSAVVSSELQAVFDEAQALAAASPSRARCDRHLGQGLLRRLRRRR